MSTETTASAGAAADLERRKKEEIASQAQALIIAARAAGYHVAIEPRPLQPLAMRNYQLEVTVWPVR